MISPDPIDETDLLLLDILQDEFPVVSNPWEIIIIKTGLSEDEILKKLTKLADKGILRGITPILESDRIGPMVSTLIAFRVPEADIDHIAGIINQYSEVSHNFKREHAYNLWFTLASGSRSRIDTIMAEILSITGISPDDVLDLSTEKKYKIDVRFPIMQKNVEIPRGTYGK